jgi:hypothetical protein
MFRPNFFCGGGKAAKKTKKKKGKVAKKAAADRSSAIATAVLHATLEEDDELVKAHRLPQGDAHPVDHALGLGAFSIYRSAKNNRFDELVFRKH